MTSLHRTKNQVEPLPSFPIFRPLQAVITAFTRAIQAFRSRATTNSSKFPWFVETKPHLSCAYAYILTSSHPHIHGATDFSVDDNIVENGLAGTTAPTTRHSGVGTRRPARCFPLPAPWSACRIGSVLYDDGSALASISDCLLYTSPSPRD